MMQETYQGESPRLKFKTKDGVTVQVTNRHEQVYTEGVGYVGTQWVVVKASFKPESHSPLTMVYTNKMLSEDLAAKRKEILAKCQQDEYKKAVHRKLRLKHKKLGTWKEDELHDFKMAHMLYEVGEDYVFKAMAKGTELAIRKILDESELFQVFLRDFNG